MATRRLLPIAGLILGLTSPALAQGTDEQREACTPDALKLCSDTIPDVARTTACMQRHAAELSPRCRAVVDAPDAGASKRSTARAYEPPSRQDPRDAADGDQLQLSRDDPAAGYGGGSIRHFAPGDGPDEVDGPGPDDGGPRRFGPGAWDGPRAADRGGPDDGPDRYGPPEPDEAPAREGAAPDASRAPKHGRHHAKAVIARLCAAGEIDERTCAVTQHALQQRRRD